MGTEPADAYETTSCGTPSTPLPRSFVILLERDGRRVQNVQRNILNKLPECEVWPATDCQNLKVDDALRRATVTVTRSYRRRVTAAKLAVSLSHLQVWHKIIDESISRAIVFEDDVKVLDSFRETLVHILREVPNDYHFIYLYGHPRHFHPDRSEHHLPEKQYVMRHSFTYTRLAYVVTIDGARRLVDYFRTLHDHGDVMINKAIEQDVICAYMSRKVVVQNLGQLTHSYEGELLASNVHPPATLFSAPRRRIRDLYNNLRKRAD